MLAADDTVLGSLLYDAVIHEDDLNAALGRATATADPGTSALCRSRCPPGTSSRVTVRRSSR